jgi:hypothetical protein
VRLAYGYAQYGYAQRENFLISPNTPAGDPRTISYQPSPLLLLRCYRQLWGAGQGGCALTYMSTLAGPRAHAMCFRAEVPAARNLTRRMPHMWRSAMANRALIAPAWLPAQELQRRQLLRDRPRGTARVGPGPRNVLTGGRRWPHQHLEGSSPGDAAAQVARLPFAAPGLLTFETQT